MLWQFGREIILVTEQHTAGTLAQALGAELDGPSDLVCTGVSSISEAECGDATFMINTKFTAMWKASKASIGIVPASINVPDHDPVTRAILRVADAELAIASVLSLFQQEDDLPAEGIHPNAVIASTATIGIGVRIGPFVEISDNAVIGDHVAIYSNVFIGRGCTIHADTVIHAGTVIGYACVVGSNCTLNSNITVGARGFGYRPSADQTELVHMPHIGNVEIGNHVEIGANTCIDRGKFAATRIGDGTKIDNLVQIGHNCIIGRHCVIAATSGLGDSVHLGDWVQIGANVGIAPHCKVGDGARIGSKSGVMHDVPPGEKWLGIPAGQIKDTLRQWVSVRKLPGIIAQFGRSEDQ